MRTPEHQTNLLWTILIFSDPFFCAVTRHMIAIAIAAHCLASEDIW